MKAKINNKNIRITAIMLMAVFSVFYFFPQKVSASEISVSAVVKLVNESRKVSGISAVVENSILNNVAKDKVKDMLKNDYFAHTSPQGKDPWYWFGKNNYKYTAAGENLALNYDNAESQHKAWMASPTHKKNILNPTYKEIGVAVAEGKINGEETTLTVQVFGAPVVAVVNKEENQLLPAMEGKVLPAEVAVEPEIPEKNIIPAVPNNTSQKESKAYISDKFGFFNTGNLMIIFLVVLILEIITFFVDKVRKARKALNNLSGIPLSF